MKKIKSLVVVGGLIACLPAILNAQDLMIYPAKGQSDQRTRDQEFQHTVDIHVSNLSG